MNPPQPEMPLPEMSVTQLASYRRALIHYLKRRTKEPQTSEARASLAEVMAEESARRQASRADGTLMVSRIHL